MEIMEFPVRAAGSGEGGGGRGRLGGWGRVAKSLG